MDKKQFAELVTEAVDNLPLEYLSKLNNIDIVIEDYPTTSQLHKVKCKRGETLLGLYEGIPVTVRSQYYNMILPDKITIFQKSIEERCVGKDEIVKEIKRIVEHEIAHHFGINDARLDQIAHEEN